MEDVVVVLKMTSWLGCRGHASVLSSLIFLFGSRLRCVFLLILLHILMQVSFNFSLCVGFLPVSFIYRYSNANPCENGAIFN